MRGSTLPALALLAALAAGAPLADAQKKGPKNAPKNPLERARTEIGELRYEDAQKTVEKALRSGTNGPPEMTELYLLYGEVKASLGEDDAAQEAFRKALVIDPSAELREGLSPKIREPFAKAHRAMKNKKPLSIQHRILKQDPPTIAILVESDPFGMVIGGRLIYENADGAERSVAGMGKQRVDLKLPRGTGKFMVAAIDEHGNRLVLLGSESDPLTLDIESGGGGAAAGGSQEETAGGPGEGGQEETGGGEETSTTVQKSSARAGPTTPFYARWMLWGGVAVGFAGVGVLTGLATRSAVSELDDVRQNSEMYEFSHAQELADKAERRALYTNIAFGAAAACAIVSGVLFFRQRGKNSQERTALVPVVGADGGGVAARIRF